MSDTVGEIALVERPLDIPFCERCGRQVDRFQVDYETREIMNHDIGYMELMQTGVAIVTVECHGETWKTKGRFK